MVLEETLPHIGLIALIISISVLIYRLGKWIGKVEASLENILNEINVVSEKMGKIPENFWLKLICVIKIFIFFFRLMIRVRTF